MVHAVHLDRLPDDLQFPAELKTKISYEPNLKQLQFEGFMSKTDFDKLLQLHNDLAYQRSLEHLFQICTFPDASQPPAGKRSAVVWASVAAAGTAAVFAVVLLWRTTTATPGTQENGGTRPAMPVAQMKVGAEIGMGAEIVAGNPTHVAEIPVYHLVSEAASGTSATK